MSGPDVAEPDGFGALPSDALASIRQVFFEECADHLSDFEAGLIALDAGDTDPELINATFRAAHSIKGGAAIFGIAVLARCAHAAETVLSCMRDRGGLLPNAVPVLLRAVDVLSDLATAAREERELDPARVDAIVAELEGIVAQPAVTAPSGDEELDDGIVFTPLVVEFETLAVTSTWAVDFRPHDSLFETANEPLLLLEQLAEFGDCVIEADLSDLPLLDALDPRGAYVRWRAVVTTSADPSDLRQLFDFVERDCDLSLEAVTSDAAGAPGATAAATEPQADAGRAQSPSLPGSSGEATRPRATMLRVDVDRVDRLINLMSELVTSEAVLTECATAFGGPEGTALNAAIEDLKGLTRVLEESVMAIRSQVLGPVFQRMSRLVREMEGRTGKQVRLVIEGEDTEVDRGLIEGLTDPLTHMIRNSIDHGLEQPEDRVRHGKPPVGEVRVRAAHRGGRVVIEVSDDGAGINLARVLESAIARGTVSADHNLTPHEIANLIFEPGLSTAEAVTDVSGRGVGMDVVRRSVQALGGRISVQTREGFGTTFVLSLPLTLAVLDGMLVIVDGERMIVPLNAVLESIKPKAAEIRTIGPQASLLSIRGDQVPYLDLASLLGYCSDAVDMDTGIALLLESDSAEPIAFRVDEIIDTRQVVIKSLEDNYQSVAGIAAATILGDGKVALIIDANGLIESRRQSSFAPERLFANA